MNTPGSCTWRKYVSAGIAAGLLLFCVTYWNTFVWLWERASGPDSYYSHAFLIPFISGYLIWRQREVLEQTPRDSSVLGLLLILGAIGLHLLSVLLNVYFTSGFSIFILMFGLSLYLLGPPLTRQIVFPLGFLIFMFPLPSAALGAISMPMKIFATWCGAGIVSLLGIPVVREGFQLHFVSSSLVIGNPCSGLRSLLALMALGSLFANLYKGALWRRVILFAATIPIALFSNILRVTALSLVASRYGSEAAIGIVHDASGIFVFVIALVLLFGLGRLLEWHRQSPAIG